MEWMKTMKNSKLNVIYISTSFLIVFTSFTISQNLQTSINKDLGFYSLGTLYFFFSFSALFSGYVVEKLGSRLSLFGGSFMYFLYVLANAYPRAYILLPASALLGIGAAMLWTAQGSYLAQNSTPESM